MATKKRKRSAKGGANARSLAIYGALGIAAIGGGAFAWTNYTGRATTPAAVASITPPAPIPPPVERKAEAPATPPRVANADVAPPRPSPKPTAAKMSSAQWATLDEALVDQIKRCWTNAGPEGAKPYIPKIKLTLDPNGAITAKPMLINLSSDPRSKALADGAIKAISRCGPLKIPAAVAPFYDEWKTRVVYFDPAVFASAATPNQH
jgi:hypothetical protein